LTEETADSKVTRFPVIGRSKKEPGVPDDVDPAGIEPPPARTLPGTTLEEIPPSERTPVAGVQEALKKRWARPGGWLYGAVRWGGGMLFAGIAVALVVSL
jgi:hypothetical protein